MDLISPGTRGEASPVPQPHQRTIELLDPRFPSCADTYYARGAAATYKSLVAPDPEDKTIEPVPEAVAKRAHELIANFAFNTSPARASDLIRAAIEAHPDPLAQWGIYCRAVGSAQIAPGDIDTTDMEQYIENVYKASKEGDIASTVAFAQAAIARIELLRPVASLQSQPSSSHYPYQQITGRNPQQSAEQLQDLIGQIKDKAHSHADQIAFQAGVAFLKKGYAYLGAELLRKIHPKAPIKPVSDRLLHWHQLDQVHQLPPFESTAEWSMQLAVQSETPPIEAIVASHLLRTLPEGYSHPGKIVFHAAEAAFLLRTAPHLYIQYAAEPDTLTTRLQLAHAKADQASLDAARQALLQHSQVNPACLSAADRLIMLEFWLAMAAYDNLGEQQKQASTETLNHLRIQALRKKIAGQAEAAAPQQENTNETPPVEETSLNGSFTVALQFLQQLPLAPGRLELTAEIADWHRVFYPFDPENPTLHPSSEPIRHELFRIHMLCANHTIPVPPKLAAVFYKWGITLEKNES